MSVLLIGAGGPLGEAIAKRLLQQGDEVRAIEMDAAAAERLRGLGVHIARGRELDADLTERAAQNVRTIVLIDPVPEELGEVVEGARFAKVERLVLCGTIPAPVLDDVRGLDMQFVALTERRRLLKKGLAPDHIASAVDAADDLAGEPRLVLELTDEGAWRELKLEGPS